MQSLNPIPHTLREAVWQALVAILLATRAKDIWGFFHRLWVALRESSSTAQVRAAEAHKTDAEAEEIETRTAINAAQWMREMTISMGQLTVAANQLKDKVASQESIIALKEAELKTWRMRYPEEACNEKNGPAA
jgi:hypothetical protein